MSSSGERPVQQQLYPPMNAATSQQQQHHRSPVDAGAPAVQQHLLWNSGRTAPPSEEGEEKVVDDGPPPGLQGKHRVESALRGRTQYITRCHRTPEHRAMGSPRRSVLSGVVVENRPEDTLSLRRGALGQLRNKQLIRGWSTIRRVGRPGV